MNLPVSEVKYFRTHLVQQRMLKYMKAIYNYHAHQTRPSEFQL